jgi:hypothetical protein
MTMARTHLRWWASAGALALLLTLLWGCASATPTPTPAPTATATPVPTPTPIPLLGPWVETFDDLIVELVVPEESAFSKLVLMHLAFSNAGSETLTFYHGSDLAEFILSKDGEQVMTSWDQLEFGDNRYTNQLGPGKTRRFETGFSIGLFEGVLVDGDFKPLPVGEYEVYGIAHMSDTDAGERQLFQTPATTIRIVAAP